MCYENDLIIFHRCDRRYNRSTITIKEARHAELVAARAKQLRVVKLADGVFYAKGDSETALQAIENLLSE